MLFPPSNILLLILGFSGGAAAHPGLAAGILLGAGGTMFLTGLMTIAVAVVITSMYTDRAQQAPPRPPDRSALFVSVDSPDTEPEPDLDNTEDSLVAPLNISTPGNRRRLSIPIPIGEILPGDGPLLPSRSRRASSSSPSRSRLFSDITNDDASSQTSIDDVRTIVPEREAGTDTIEASTPKAGDPSLDRYDYLQYIGAVGAQGRSADVEAVSMEQMPFQRVRSVNIEDRVWRTPYSKTCHDDQGSAASTESDSSESSAHSLDLSLNRSPSLSTTSSQYEQRMLRIESYNTIDGVMTALNSEEINAQCNEARVEKIANLKQNIEVQGRIAEGEGVR